MILLNGSYTNRTQFGWQNKLGTGANVDGVLALEAPLTSTIYPNAINGNDYHDDFNRPNGLAGAGWDGTMSPAGDVGVYGGLTLAGSAIGHSGDPDGDWDFNDSFVHPNEFELTIDLTDVSSTFSLAIDFGIQNPGATRDGYELYFESNGNAWLYRIDDGAETEIGFYPSGLNFQDNDKIHLQRYANGDIVANRIRAGVYDFLVSAGGDTTYTTGGYLGLYISDDTFTVDNLWLADTVNSPFMGEPTITAPAPTQSISASSINSPEYSDNFNRSNGLVGNGWTTTDPVGGTATYGNLTITSNAVVPTGDPQGDWGYNPYISLPDEAIIEWQLASVSGTFQLWLDFALKDVGSVAEDEYAVFIQQDGQAWIYRVDNNSSTQIGYSNSGLNFQAGDRIRILRDNNTIVANRIRSGSAAALVSATDSNFTAGGYLGLFLTGNVSIDSFWAADYNNLLVSQNPTITQGTSSLQTITLTGHEIASGEAFGSATVVNILASQIINFIAQSTNTQSSSSTWTVNSPDIGVIQTGDLIIIGTLSDGVNIATSPPNNGIGGDFSDLTEINENSDATLKLWYQFAQGSNNDPTTYSITWDTACAGVAFCIVYRGVTGITGTTGTNQSSATTAHDWGPITPQFTKAMVVAVIGCDPAGPGLAFTWDAPYTERFDATNSNLAQVALADQPVSSKTSTAAGGDYPGGEGAAVVIFSLESRRIIDLIINSISSAESVSQPTVTKRNTITLSTGQEIASAESVSNPTLTKRNTISLNSVNSSETFDNPTVSNRNTIALNSINSSEAFDNPTITKRNTIALNAINSSEAFDSPTVTNRATIALNSVNSSEAFDNPTVTSRATIVLNSVNSAETFDNPTITQGSVTQTIVLTGHEIGSAESVSQPTLTKLNTIVPNSINSSESVSNPTITNLSTIVLTGNEITSAESVSQPSITKLNIISVNSINSSEAFDNPTVSSRATIILNAINSLEAFDNPTLSNRNTISLNSVNSSEAFENPTVQTFRTVSLNSVDSAEAFGNPQLSIVITSSIASTEVVSNPSVTTQKTIILTGHEIASAEAFENPSFTQFNGISANSVNSSETFDNPTVSSRATINLTGQEINSSEIVSSPTLRNLNTVVLTGFEINSGFASDNPTISFRNTITLNSINSAEAFDNPSVRNANAILANSVDSAESVNNPFITNLNTININTINSAESFNSPTLTFANTISLNSVNSSETFENPTVRNGFTITLDSINSSETFGNPNVLPIFPTSITSAEFVDQPVILTGAFLIQPNSINSGESVSNPTLTTGGVSINLNSVNSAESVSNPTVTSIRVINANSINSSETFDSPTVTNKATITPNAISSAELVNTPIITNLSIISLNSVVSSESVSNPIVSNQSTVVPNSYDGSSAPSNPSLSTFNLITPSSINSIESVSNPIVSAFRTVNLNSVSSSEIVNNIIVTTLNQIHPNEFGGETFSTDLEVFKVVPGPQGVGGIGSLEALGLPRIGFGINLNSITSEEVVSSPFVITPITIWIVNPISSSEGFGSVIITNNRIQPISGISVSGTSIVYPPVHSAGGTGVVIIGSAITVPSPGTPANPGGSVTIGTIEGVRTPLL